MRFSTLIFCLCAAAVFSQERLALDDAIKIALEKNLGVQSSRNAREIARAQNNAGNAGLSPTISLNGGLNGANVNSYQVFSTGTDQRRNGAVNYGMNGSVNADWIIFDGFRMFAVKKRLMLGEDVSELQLRGQMESTVYDVIASYYDIVRSNELLKAAKRNLAFFEERRKLAEVRQDIGSGSKVDLLLSRSDESRARASIIQLELGILNSKTSLNSLLGRSEDVDFTVADTITTGYDPSYDELKKNIPNANTDILIARKQELIADQMVKEARANNLPFITLNGAYLFTKTSSQAGFLLSSRQTGFSGGATARWIIFNGSRNSRLVKERTLLALNQKLFTGQTMITVNSQAYLAFQRFQMNKRLADMELQSVRDAAELQSISMERYRIGNSSILETIEAQRNLEDAQARYIDALYNMKIAEAALMRANGALVK